LLDRITEDSVRSSAKWALSACTVVHREKELCCEFLRNTRITEDSEELCQEGIEQVKKVENY
jgi:hypothetical protein